MCQAPKEPTTSDQEWPKMPLPGCPCAAQAPHPGTRRCPSNCPSSGLKMSSSTGHQALERPKRARRRIPVVQQGGVIGPGRVVAEEAPHVQGHLDCLRGQRGLESMYHGGAALQDRMGSLIQIVTFLFLAVRRFQPPPIAGAAISAAKASASPAASQLCAQRTRDAHSAGRDKKGPSQPPGRPPRAGRP